MYKGAVVQYLKKYIKDLQPDQVESYLLSGECTLHSFEMEPCAVSDWVSEIFPYTAEVESVFCSRANIKIPWAQIKTKPLLITIQHMDVCVSVHDFREQEWNMRVSEVQKKLFTNRDFNTQIPVTGLKQFELGWTDYMYAGVQIRIETCSIILRSNSPTRLRNVHIEIESVCITPIHHSSESSTIIDNPHLVYQYIPESGRLCLTRLITLKSFRVLNEGVCLVTHSPGFRLRLSSQYTAVKLFKNIFAVAPFPCETDSSLWMDKLIVDGEDNFDALVALYALFQDLMAPVVVPPEALNVENRHAHYTYTSIVRAKSDIDLVQELALDTPDLHTAHVHTAHVQPVHVQQVDVEPLSHPQGGPIIDLKRLFVTLAKEVRSNANKAHHKTDTIVSHGKNFLKSTFKKKKLPSGSPVVALGVVEDSPEIGHISFADSPHVDASGDESPVSVVEDFSGRNTDRKSSDGGFQDAIDEDVYRFGRVDSVYHSEEEQDAGGECVGGFAVWKEDATSSLLVISEKLCVKSQFHLHVEEIVIQKLLSTIQFDVTVRSETPKTFIQLMILSNFAQNRFEFINKIKQFIPTQVCPLDPVNAMTSLSAATLTIRGKDGVKFFSIGATSGGSRGLGLSWKSKTSSPNRLFGASVPLLSKLQPVEGCIHEVAVNGDADWPSLISVLKQLQTAAGEYSDPSFDLEMKLRLCLRDASVRMKAFNANVPNCIMTRNFSKESSLENLLVSLQTLPSIPANHWGDACGVGTEFPFNGAFFSCICGQETTSYSWALPGSAELPVRVQMADGSGGLVVERIWKDLVASKPDSDDVLITKEEYCSLINTKLKLLEQGVVLEQLRETEGTLRSELTHKNALLKQQSWIDVDVETAVCVLTEKVCALETYINELSGEKIINDLSLVELRNTCGDEITSARVDLLSQTTSLRYQLSELKRREQILEYLNKTQKTEIDTLKRHIQFLLGIGTRMTSNALSQTDS